MKFCDLTLIDYWLWWYVLSRENLRWKLLIAIAADVAATANVSNWPSAGTVSPYLARRAAIRPQAVLTVKVA